MKNIRPAGITKVIIMKNIKPADASGDGKRKIPGAA